MSSEPTCLVRNLRPNTPYVFVVRARNSHGLSGPSNPSKLVTTKGMRSSTLQSQLRDTAGTLCCFVWFVFAARCYASAAYAVMRCLSVRPPVTFVHSVKTNKHILKIISPSGSHTILVSPYPTAWRRGRASNAGGVGINCDSEPISDFIACCERCDRQVLSTRRVGLWQVVTLSAGSKRRSLLMAGDDDKMFLTTSLNVTPKTIERHLIVRGDKSVA